MNQSIEQRMLNIEQELSEIRKELEESLGRYNTSFLKPSAERTIQDGSKDLASKQETLPAEFQQVLADNIWELYEK